MGLFNFVKNAGAKLFSKKTVAKEAAPEAESTAPSQADLDAQKAVELEELVKGMGFDIENLYVEVSDDVATIHGQTASIDDKEMAVLVAGNVEGIATIDDRIMILSEAPAEPAGGESDSADDSEGTDRSISVSEPVSDTQFHTVVKGDTLSKIAKVYYGNALKYPVIFEANRPMLKHPDKIYPGQMLRVPALSA